jgi:hypothetical protein
MDSARTMDNNGLIPAGNPKAQDLEANGKRLPILWSEMAKQVPFQAQQILISWIFVFASVALFLDFVGLQSLEKCVIREVSCSSAETYFRKLDNWFGTISCVWWLTGFAVLQHWLARISATRWGQFGCFLKLVASVFFNIQPMTGIQGTRHGAGLAWSNLTGILLFHSGNLVSCADFFVFPPPGSNKRGSWFEYGNLPITGMWIYQLATWFLVLANLVTCDWHQVVDPTSKGPSTQFMDTDSFVVIVCQYAGALLLLLGSIVYGIWCNAFRSLALK